MIKPTKRRCLRKAEWEALQQTKHLGCPVCKEKGIKSKPFPVTHWRHNALEVDHIIPLSEGGSNEIHNLQWLCRYHNRTKGKNPVMESYLFTNLDESYIDEVV